MTNFYKNRWFNIKKPAPNALIRLFCFPYAGGSAQIFSDWCDSLPPEIEVIGVQYPGRGSRFVDPLIGSCDGMVEALIPNITPVLDKPFVFFGHSNGGMLSFELARKLQQQGITRQLYHFVSAKRAIHLPARRRALHALPEQEFIEELENLGGTPKEILEQRELMALFLPVLRSDFSLSETFSYEGDHKLHCDATLLYGSKDTDVPKEDVLKWHELIDGKVDTRVYDGDHFFINSHKEEVLNYLSEKLTELLQKIRFSAMS
jgi:medium-chain acyl-[acyl-carrier-protein] hydrolase